jgi:hypothetical protein
MAMRLDKENVRIVFMDIVSDVPLYGSEDKEAEHNASYIAGALDMANAVIRAIEELGGK